MEYPSILKRVQSTFVDQIISFTLIGLLILLANDINEHSINLKILAALLGASYEPLMTFVHRTLGQIVTGVKVVSDNESKSRPDLLRLYLRFILKITLGWISLIVITSNDKRQAIHDMASGTLVVFKKHTLYEVSEPTIKISP